SGSGQHQLRRRRHLVAERRWRSHAVAGQRDRGQRDRSRALRQHAVASGCHRRRGQEHAGRRHAGGLRPRRFDRPVPLRGRLASGRERRAGRRQPRVEHRGARQRQRQSAAAGPEPHLQAVRPELQRHRRRRLQDPGQRAGGPPPGHRRARCRRAAGL
ncbi:hypothetical protein OY671_011838, partial [Metschnikowia pulcherrima]